MHHHEPQQAFRQFQYPTVPLHVRSDHIEQAWHRSNERVSARLAAADPEEV